MRRTCPDCGHEHQLGEMLLPDCPQCILSRCKHLDGIKVKHTLSGAMAASAAGASLVSYHVDGFDPRAVTNYMGSGIAIAGGAISGCEVFLNTRHNSINAVSRLPLGQIQGSGITPTGQYAAHHATLCDIEGKSSDGPHYFFESDADKAKKIADGIYVPLPLCSGCGIVPWRAGALCPPCASAKRTLSSP